MYKKLLTIFILSVSLVWSDTNETKRSEYALFTSKDKDKFPSRLIHFAINGKEYLDEGDLQSALDVDSKSMFEFWSDEKPAIKDKLLPTLNETLLSYLDSEGFYDANYTIKTTPKEVFVTITENEPVRVNDINISSDYDISEIVRFKRGEIFKADQFTAIKSAIVNEMMKEGYCSYNLENKAYVDLEKLEVDIVYDLKKGGVCTFGKISVKSPEGIKDGVVISRVRAREGTRFDLERIQHSYDALYGLAAFDSVAIKYDRKFYNVVPIDVAVTQISKPWSFLGGIEYDTNVGAGIKSELTRKNFMGNAKKLKINLQYSAIEQLAEVSLFTPALFSIGSHYFDLATKVGYSNLEYTGFMEKKGYAQAYLAYTNERLELNAGFAMENIDISLLENYDKAKLTQGINAGTFLLAYPFARIIFDARDSKLNPKYGFYLAADVEYGLPYSEEASEYLKYELEGRAIYTFNSLTMAVVAKVGVVDERENLVPESKLFFAGGAYSNRAYGYRRVGVIFDQTQYGIDGALTMANLSLEADYPIVGNFYGAIFTDNTMQTINSYDFSGEILTSAGVGIRYMTPIGPIKVDVAANVHDTSQYGIHFQIGQSF